MNYAEQIHALAALPLLAEKIVIHTDADFTPKGKRTARIVTTSRGGKSLRWYVGGKIFRKGAPLELTAEWLKG